MNQVNFSLRSVGDGTTMGLEMLPSANAQTSSTATHQRASAAELIQQARIEAITSTFRDRSWKVDEVRNISTSLEWSISRLQVLQREILHLQRRHDVRLTVQRSEPAIDPTCVRVKAVVGPALTPHTVVSFSITSNYPFGPLLAEIEALPKFADVTTVRKHLLKRSRSGFGQLTRCCDVLAALSLSKHKGVAVAQ